MDTLDFTPLVPPRLEKLPAEKLRLAPVGDRFRLRAHLKEIEHLHEIRLRALHYVEPDLYYVISGTTIFVTGLEHGVPEFTVEIVGEIDNVEQAIWARTLHVFDRHRPFHVLEQARCILDANEKLIVHFGPDKFNGHGGDRRSPGRDKLSLTEAVGQRLPFAKSRIGIQLRLAGHLGPWGMEGLYRVLKGEKRKLTIGRVNRRNARLKRENIRARIEAAVKEMEADGKSREEILSRAGAIAYAALFEKAVREELPDVEPYAEGQEPEDSAAETDAEGIAESGPQKEPHRGIYRPIPVEAKEAILAVYMELLDKSFEKIDILYAPGDMTAAEVEETHAWSKEVQTIWTTYMTMLLRHGQRRQQEN